MIEGQVVEEWEQDGKRILFRHPRWQDLDQYIAMQNVFHQEEIMASHWETDRKRGAEMLSRCLMEDELGGHSHLVVEVEGRLVGWGGIAPSEGHQSCTLGIAIIGEYQKQGIGTRLTKALVDEAERLGYARIVLTVWGINWVAYHLYHKLGFREVGRHHDWIRTDHAPSGFSDLVWMVKELRQPAK